MPWLHDLSVLQAATTSSRDGICNLVIFESGMLGLCFREHIGSLQVKCWSVALCYTGRISQPKASGLIFRQEEVHAQVICVDNPANSSVVKQ